MRALISVSDKTGVVEFARGLRELGWQVIATGGTMKLLAESGVEVINISDVTGFPEICDGRVKTLHPKVHGGLLARRDDPNHLKALRENGIEFIDMVCVNLYPFRQTIAREGVTMDEAIENIDIGGPSMLRSAAKNYKDVTVVCDPADYDTILAEIRGYGNTTPRLRLQLSAKAYTHTAEYDAMIATYMREKAGLDEKLFLEFDLVQPLRYGENPHQQAKFYRSGERVPYSLAYARQLNGKEMSYNNIQDANAALAIVREFDEPFCVGLKHMNPCGAAVGRDAADAWTKAYEADKVSIFGGIVALNRPVTREAAELMKPIFLEIIMAPSFTPEALEVLSTKKNLRLLEVPMEKSDAKQRQLVSVTGGLLVQDLDLETRPVTADMCVTEKRPTERQLADLVQEQGPAVRFLKIALSRLDGSGKRTLLVTKKFRIYRPFRYRSAVYGKVFVSLSEAVLMDDLWNILLADTALARYKHGEVSRGDGHGRLKGSVKSGIITNDVVFVFKSLQFL